MASEAFQLASRTGRRIKTTLVRGVKDRSGRTKVFRFFVRPSKKIKWLKQKIKHELGDIPKNSSINLLIDGENKTLTNRKRIQDCGIRHGSVLLLFVCKRYVSNNHATNYAFLK